MLNHQRAGARFFGCQFGWPRGGAPFNLAAVRLLDRYLFRELLTPLVYCLGGFLIFWVSFDLFNELGELQDRKLHLRDIVEYVAVMTPEVLVTVLPIALLLALLYALTQHSRHNEITAMRAAGTSLLRLAAPYFLVGLAASVALFALSELVVPRSTNYANRILTRYVHKAGDDAAVIQFHGFRNARENRLWNFDVYRVPTAEMSAVKVSWTETNGTWWQLQAERAAFTNGAWTFFKAVEYAQLTPNGLPVQMLATNSLVERNFDETPKQIESEIKIGGYRDIRASHKPDLSLKDIYNYLRLHPVLQHDQIWLPMEFHNRLAAPWTCLVVVFIAIPFGAGSGRRNLFFGVAGSIFICFAFFVVQKIGLFLGLGGHLPAWLAAWLPNLIFAVAGLALTARVR